MKKTYLYIILLIVCVLGSTQNQLSAADLSRFPSQGSRKSKASPDSLKWSISVLKRVFNGSGEWFLINDSIRKPIKGILDYAENDPVDTVVVQMTKVLKADSIPLFFDRKPEDVPNKRIIRGYLSTDEIERLVEKRKRAISDSMRRTHIQVPEDYLHEGLSKAPVIPDGDVKLMLSRLDRELPSAFRNRYYKDLASRKIPQDVTEQEMDSLKARTYLWSRQSYNDSVLFSQRDTLIRTYRQAVIFQKTDAAGATLHNKLISRNSSLLNSFNTTEVARVNDSIRVALRFLTDHAASDSVLVNLSNVSGDQTKIWTANHPMVPMRMFLKNEQNDSLSVILYNDGKGVLRLVIDDVVKLNRLKETDKKEITFQAKKPDSKLLRVKIREAVPLPWKMFGNGTVGFTQTSLSNWAKGGESSLSLLLIEKYVANYSRKNLKWENQAEFRLGIFQSATRGLEKNDDKIELQSRMGYSAFKKWYYSAEGNFRTQMARGYKYPDKTNPISTFMAPGYLTFSIGMDYKPNKNFSLFISPLTSKSTFIRDTTLIHAANYGVPAGQKRLWEPGIIIKTNWHANVMENVTYDTRAEIFNNYRYTFQKFNFDWEQSLVMQVNRFISVRMMTQLIYDYNVKFPIKDETGKQIDQQAKWQFKELLTVGFNYRF